MRVATAGRGTEAIGHAGPSISGHALDALVANGAHLVWTLAFEDRAPRDLFQTRRTLLRNAASPDSS